MNSPGSIPNGFLSPTQMNNYGNSTQNNLVLSLNARGQQNQHIHLSQTDDINSNGAFQNSFNNISQQPTQNILNSNGNNVSPQILNQHSQHHIPPMSNNNQTSSANSILFQQHGSQNVHQQYPQGVSPHQVPPLMISNSHQVRTLSPQHALSNSQHMSPHQNIASGSNGVISPHNIVNVQTNSHTIRQSVNANTPANNSQSGLNSPHQHLLQQHSSNGLQQVPPSGIMGPPQQLQVSSKLYPPNQPMIFNSQNPNAPPIHPCGFCRKEVQESEDAIMCESGCNFWFHRQCISMSSDAFHFIKNEIFAEWVCDVCVNTKRVAPVKFKS